MIKPYYTILLLLPLFIGGCQTEEKPKHNYEKVNRGMYFWQNRPELAKQDFQELNKLGVEKCYLKVFEVKPDPIYKAVPEAEVSFEYQSPRLKRLEKHCELIPVVYLTNQTLAGLQADEMNWLAQKVDQKMNSIRFGPAQPQEIQIDCDWTVSTRDKYFAFLRRLKNKSRKDISVTLRLHQIKDQDTMGVPPADRAVLMYYNMGNLTAYDETNSILNNEVGRAYLAEGTSYKLPLDFALPAFSWGLLFRYQQFEGIVNDFAPNKLPETVLKSQQDQPWYQIKADTTIGGTYFRYNDEIRYEQSRPKKLLEAINVLKRINTPNDTTNVIFYHWDEAKTYDPNLLDSVYRAF